MSEASRWVKGYMLSGWVYLWLFRLSSGEKLEHGSRENTRFWLASLPGVAVVFAIFPKLGYRYLPNAGSVTMWCFTMLAIAALFSIWHLVWGLANLITIIILTVLS